MKIDSYIKEQFGIKDVDIRTYSPLTLAYIGDEMCIRDRFYNTLTRQIDTVVPRVDGKIGMYTCGPTVYHFAHIGNIRSYKMCIRDRYNNQVG